jgi:uncharacterized peroxidase-related enzyme
MTETMIELHDEKSAPESVKPILAGVERTNGFIPNMFRALANSPSTLSGFVAMVEANDGGTLSPIERQIVQLAASIENQGSYCVAGHSSFAARMGLPLEPIAALREGGPLVDKRYQGLADFTRAVVRKRGHVTAEDKAAFVASGFRAEQMFEVIAGVALKSVTNYVGGVFNLPLDDQFQAQAWTADSDKSRAA